MLGIKSKLKNKLLNYFFLNEKNGAYVNEIARLTGSDPKNAHRELLKLLEDGLLIDKYIGKARYFYPNVKNHLYAEYKNIFLKTAGVENNLKQKLKNLEGLRKAYIFGSYANNKIGPGSDIDLLLVGSHNRLDAQKTVFALQKEINKEINVINLNENELKKKLAGKDQLINSIFSHKKIELI